MGHQKGPPGSRPCSPPHQLHPGPTQHPDTSTGPSPPHSGGTQHTHSPLQQLSSRKQDFQCRSDSPVWLRKEELRPISCHGRRVSGVGGQLWRCPLRVRIVGLDEGDIAQQGGVGGAENLLSHLQWIVWCHLQVREERGARSRRAHCFQTSRSPTLCLTPATSSALCPSVTVEHIEGNMLEWKMHRAQLPSVRLASD